VVVVEIDDESAAVLEDCALIGAVKAMITIASAVKLRVRMKFLDGAKDASPS